MGRKVLSEGRIQQLKLQTSIFDEKIWEDRKVALARYKISAKLTRPVVKIMIARAKKCDVYFEIQKIYLSEIEGGWQSTNGKTYKIAKEEIELMAGDGLLVELIKGEKATFFNFFGGKIAYDDKERCIYVTLNPLLKPYYNKIGAQFTVLMLSEYLRLSVAFYKDLYEWLIAHQGKQDYKFTIMLENFCKHFNCEKCLKTHRDDVYNRILRAKKEIEALTELRFDVTPHYMETNSKTRKGTLDKLFFVVHSGPYYKAIQEEKAKLEEAQARFAQAQEAAILLQEAENLGDDQLPLEQQMLRSIESKIEQEKEKNKVHVAANLDDIPDDKWNEMVREALGGLFLPEDEEEEKFEIDDNWTEEEEEEIRQKMEEFRKEEGIYYADDEISKFFEDE